MRCEELLEFLVGVCAFASGIGTVHIPFEGCLVPCKINLLSLNMYTKCLVKYTKQLLSHNYPMNKSDADISDGKTCPCSSVGDS